MIRIFWRPRWISGEDLDQREHGRRRLALSGRRDQHWGHCLPVYVLGEVGVELLLDLFEIGERLRVEFVDGVEQAQILAGASGERLKGAVGVGGPRGADNQVAEQRGAT